MQCVRTGTFTATVQSTVRTVSGDDACSRGGEHKHGSECSEYVGTVGTVGTVDTVCKASIMSTLMAGYTVSRVCPAGEGSAVHTVSAVDPVTGPGVQFVQI